MGEVEEMSAMVLEFAGVPSGGSTGVEISVINSGITGDETECKDEISVAVSKIVEVWLDETTFSVSVEIPMISSVSVDISGGKVVEESEKVSAFVAFRLLDMV